MYSIVGVSVASFTLFSDTVLYSLTLLHNYVTFRHCHQGSMSKGSRLSGGLLSNNELIAGLTRSKGINSVNFQKSLILLVAANARYVSGWKLTIADQGRRCERGGLLP